MEFSLSPGYKDLFNHDCLNPQSLISEYHSEGVIYYLAFLNAQVYLNDDSSPKFQSELVEKIITFWPPQQKSDFRDLLSRYLIRFKSEMNVFKPIYITYFISDELKHFRDTGKVIDPLAEYNILKAYFAYIDLFNQEFTTITSKSKIEVNDPLYFQKLHWPFLIRQFDFNEKADPVYQTICSGLVLEHFFLDSNHFKQIESYLKSHNRNSVWQFIFDFIELFKISFSKSEEFDVNYFAIRQSPDFNSILDTFSIDISEFKQDKSLHKDNLGIKKKPLFKSSEGHYIVLNWKFLYSSVYLGIALDFMSKSLLNYNSFKSKIGYDVIEKRFFRSLFKYMFEKQHSVIEFNEEEGMPDCYLRIGKYIFLIEVKDYLISTETISSGSFETIKNHLDLCFVRNEKNKAKGISQLLNQINDIEESCYSFDNFISKGIKKRNIVVIPIIITTSFTYQMPGVNKYLNEIMTQNLPRTSFKKIYPLTIIDFKFFFRQFMRIRSKEIKLIDLIDHYHKKINEGRIQFNKKLDFNAQFLANSAFEESLVKNTKVGGFPQKEKGFSQGLFDALKVNPELTTLPKN